MEENTALEEIPIIDEKAFKAKLDERKKIILDNFYKHNILSLFDYSGVNKYKSVRRAIRRGKLSIFGDALYKRPFNNVRYAHTKKGLNDRDKKLLKKEHDEYRKVLENF